MTREKEAERGGAAALVPGFGGRLLDWAWVFLFIVSFAWLGYQNFVLDTPDFSSLQVGSLHLSPFGLFVALDILFGYYLVRLWALRFGLDWQKLGDQLVWIVLIGLYLSHLVSVAFYFPEDLGNLRVLLDPRSRISSFGGMFGGGLVALALFRRSGLPALRYGDALVYGFTGGYIFGRLGCFSVHDHPGRETDFWLAVFDGTVYRHDLGLYEMFLMIVLFVAMTWWCRHSVPPSGSVLAYGALAYAPVRFALDSLRVADVAYGGLTPGQWFSIPLFLIGLFLALKLRSRRKALVAAQG